MSNITKGLTEAFGRYDRRDAYQRDYDSSVAGMGKRQSQAYQADGGANDEGWDEPQRDYTPKPVAKKGFYFYKVPADQDAKAQEVGLFRTKSGKWYSPFQNTRADMFFGPGKYWEPKTNESQLSELSNKTLASYKKKAGDDATQADKKGDYKRGDKRMSGIIKATKKEFDNDSKGVAEGSEQEYKIYFVIPEHEDYPDRHEPTERTIVLANSPGEAARKFKAETPEAYIKDIIPLGQPGVAEGGEKDRQWSNKDMERLRVATKDFDDIMASDGPDQTKHDLIKKRIQTKPMTGPKGVLPEQGVAEEKQRLDPSCWKGYKKQGTKMKGDTRVNNCVPVKESAIMKGLK